MRGGPKKTQTKKHRRIRVYETTNEAADCNYVHNNRYMATNNRDYRFVGEVCIARRLSWRQPLRLLDF